MYAAGTKADAVRHLDAFLAECRDSTVPELHRLAKTISRWRKQILAHHTTNASNGPTEAMNLLIKAVKRVSVNRPSWPTLRVAG
jgi:transposase